MSPVAQERIDAEVERVAKVARSFLESAGESGGEMGVADMSFQTFMVGAVVVTTDVDGEETEFVWAGFETRSQTMQRGMVTKLAETVGS